MKYMMKKEAPNVTFAIFGITIPACVNLLIEQVKELSKPDMMWLCTFKGMFVVISLNLISCDLLTLLIITYEI